MKAPLTTLPSPAKQLGEAEDMATSTRPGRESTSMERRSINPWSWSIKLGFDQAQLIEGHERLLVCSGQDAVDADGNPQHPGDMAAQLEFALDNLEAVLAAAEMTLANVVRLNLHRRRRCAVQAQRKSYGPLRELALCD
jgi:enamine deaminase RidA (YjgF/YER057c/UK114 family)